MDTNTSGEELLTKIRKPYTITKQRERWTEDEHDRFLEALRLYGRAWQRIEEHIGTKTAVQIRSHAQKFFTKLEKEAEAKGIPVCQALDIEIPPPRPKRKPNTPYPRKPGAASSSQVQVSSSSAKKDAKLVSSSSASSSHCNLDLEKTPLSENNLNGGQNQDDNCSGVSTLNKSSLPKKVTAENPNTESESLVRKASKILNMDDKAVQDVPKKNNKDRDSDNNNVPMHHNYPWHVPVHDFMFRPMEDHRVHATSSSATTTTTTTCSLQNQESVLHQTCHSQEDYRSFLQISSTFSNLVVSTLLQNPAAHAAATYAASVWPYPNSGDSSHPPPPSIAAIAAATVAAATAWWASHGLLPHPLCAPPPTCLPLQTVAVSVPTMAETGKENEMDTNEIEKQDTALQEQNLASKSPPASSSDDSEETGVTKITAAGDKVEEEAVVVASEHDSNNGTQKKKLVDRSSCGSNTPSGSDDAEEETNALDHKMEEEKDKEDDDVMMKETDTNQSSVMELSNRRSNSKINNNNNNNQTTDSWKEVSEGGRIAFQALFARERLPQSFSPPLEAAANANGKQQSDKSMSTTPMATNFNNKIQDSSSCDQEKVVTIGIGPGKSVKTRQTGGFKPYKRCSMEAKETQVINGNGNTNNHHQSDEKVSKRLRLEAGEASTT